MSRTYRFPREALDDSITRDEFDVNRRIRERLEKQKRQRGKKKQATRVLERSFKKMISYRDRERSKVRS